jgi:hypothetical protein
MHAGRTVTDRNGRVAISARTQDLSRYQFATRSSDFLVCRHCGVYVGALITVDAAEGRRSFATLNTRALAWTFTQAPASRDYDGESAEARTARRVANWTPAVLELHDM